MELEFDKEIDAILRKARGGGAVATASTHLDADSVAAFAENAVPAGTRLRYVEHFASCDGCRRMLSQSIRLNSEADLVAGSSALVPATAQTEPWYRKFFRTQNLALAFGAMTLIFAGALGFLVLQNRNAEINVSQVTEPLASGAPNFNEASSNTANSMAPANSTASPPMANTMANTAGVINDPAAGKIDTLSGRRDAAPTGGGLASECQDCGSPPSEDKSVMTPPAAVAAAAPPPAPTNLGSSIASDRDEKKAEHEKLKDDNADDVMAKRKQLEQAELRARSVDSLPTPPKKATGRSGPFQNQTNQTQRNVYDNTATRTAGGRSFTNRNGVWYDAAYRNQATENYRRGTAEYKKLDNGLRSIADTIGGTVVLVWNGKVYRVQ